MKTDDLTGRALDYWCARALVDDDEEIRFAAIEPELVVTLAHGELRLLDQRFAPSTDWSDAAIVLELARELTLTTHDDGSVHCRARFMERGESGEATGATLRVALLRAFVRARSGSELDDRLPDMPHAVRRGAIVPIEAGGEVPTYAEDGPRETDPTGDIRSVPRT